MTPKEVDERINELSYEIWHKKQELIQPKRQKKELRDLYENLLKLKFENHDTSNSDSKE